VFKKKLLTQKLTSNLNYSSKSKSKVLSRDQQSSRKSTHTVLYTPVNGFGLDLRLRLLVKLSSHHFIMLI